MFISLNKWQRFISFPNILNQVVEFSGSGFGSGSGSGVRDITILNGRINSVIVVLDATLSDVSHNISTHQYTLILSVDESSRI